MINATAQQLRKAANIQEKIQALQKEIVQLLGAPAQPETAPRGRRKLSAQGLANIRAGVRKRMAAKAAPQRKRKFSAAGRARLAALAKARWAAAKKAGKSRL